MSAVQTRIFTIGTPTTEAITHIHKVSPPIGTDERWVFDIYRNPDQLQGHHVNTNFPPIFVMLDYSTQTGIWLHERTAYFRNTNPSAVIAWGVACWVNELGGYVIAATNTSEAITVTPGVVAMMRVNL